MKVYIAGKLGTTYEKELLDRVDHLCKELGLKTFLPHRDVGLAESMNDTKRIFEGDIINGFKDVKIVVAVLDGLHVGAGTAWEIGYAYAKKIPVIGIKTDEKIEDCLEQLSAIIIESTIIVQNFQELKKEITKCLKL
jgi:nucleoside 2-deoxyribosyltransferase